MSNREIERKWLVYDDMDLDVEGEECTREQSYLSIKLEIRISKKTTSDGISDYKLTIKGEGTIDRLEIEKELSEQEYCELFTLTDGTPPILKQSIRDSTSFDHIVYISRVDDRWCYAEIEFDSIEEANNFIPYDWMSKEITDTFRMRDYYINRIYPWRL